MKLPILISFGKFISFISRILNLGDGSTWPGHMALNIEPNFIKKILKKSKTKIILIAGTNGKTTTGKLIKTILEESKYKVFQNQSGANLLNGIASSILLHSNILCELDYDFAVFELDENSLPLVLKELTPHYLILLNLFRDQLDRYGEVNIIAEKWKLAIEQLGSQTILILNADDPQIAYLSLCHLEFISGSRVNYFGLDDKSLAQKSHQHAVDSTYCPRCSTKLNYKTIYYSHLGDWNCPNCKLIRPKLDNSKSPFYPLTGIYNNYNTNASVLFAKLNHINNATIKQSLCKFAPVFGRQETIDLDGKKVQIFLSKNPTSFNESLRTIMSKNAKHVLFVLNDRIPDGRDVSWIWDVDFEEFVQYFSSITISGDRTYDMGLRIKYSVQSSKLKVKSDSSKFKIYDNLEYALKQAMEQLRSVNHEVLYILPTYSAMLEVRKILTGRKIL